MWKDYFHSESGYSEYQLIPIKTKLNQTRQSTTIIRIINIQVLSKEGILIGFT